MKFPTITWKIFLGLSIALLPSVAQDSRGTILGRVSDQSGAAIENAKVEAVNVDTGVRSTSTSNSSGDYIVPYLLPGNYNVSVEQPGFKRYSRAGVTLREGDRISV